MTTPKAELSQLSKPDFNGRWNLVQVEGDMNQFMVDAGVGWTVRKMAKGMNWGVGKTSQQISQQGDDFSIIHQQPLNNTTMTFSVGAGFQETIGIDGQPVLCSATWDGSSLIVECRRKDGAAFAPSRRYIESQQMVIEGTTSKGHAIRRYYAKH
jgi:hypothetical protein